MYGALGIDSRENNMKTLRIRKFTVICLFLLLLFPWLFFVAAQVLETKTLGFGISDKQKADIKETVQLIETNLKNWKDPVWQNRLNKHLENTNMNVLLQSALNETIYQSVSNHEQSFMKSEQFSLIEDGQVTGKVSIYYSNSRLKQIIAAFVGLIVAFFIVGYFMRRNILIPLEKMSNCARKIAEGDLDVQLPSSEITEIAEVRDGFHVMVAGLKKSFQKQVEMEAERRFIIASVAHDLRTPLFALRGYLDGLEKGIATSPEKQAKYIAVCKEKSAQLDRLVEDLFTYTKTEYSEIEFNLNKVDFTHVLKKAIDSIMPQAQLKYISITEGNFPNHCMINGDAHLLERALNNLLDNAVRHSPTKGRIFIHCYQESDRVYFTIRDTGKGFSADELHHVFEPLYRGEVSRNYSTGGFGLGLTISQRIIRQHGGDIIAENDKEGGALLTGWVPLAS